MSDSISTLQNLTTRLPYDQKLRLLRERHKQLLTRPNQVDTSFFNGIYDRWENPIITREHVPLEWRFDLNQDSNPHLLERLGVNATLNAGAMLQEDGKVLLAVRIEGNDRKSFFGWAESASGVDNFTFRPRPIVIPPNPDEPGETNLYDIRLVKHEDGYTYACFCSERLADGNAPGDLSTAFASGGLARSKDLENWERLPNLQTSTPQQRNHVLHSEFIDGKYAFYTRPQSGFMDNAGEGIGFGTVDDIMKPVIREEKIVDPRAYHTIKEMKNGMGGPPLKTERGWLHVAHGVRGCASGLRYVLYAFVCDLNEPWRVIAHPGGHLLAPLGPERVGDVSNVLFSNGLVARDNGDVYIYYASSDTRLHVATSTVDQLLDYCFNTPEDGGNTHACTRQRIDLIERNQASV